MTHINPSKSAKHITKGDKYAQKGKFKAALKQYRRAQELDPDNLFLYDKLIETHKIIKTEWTDKDFAESLAWTMQKQELENPKFKRVHARMEPEWKEITQLIQRMMQVEDEKTEVDLVEQIVAYEDLALYPLIEVILSFKELQKKIRGVTGKEKENQEPKPKD